MGGAWVPPPAPISVFMGVFPEDCIIPARKFGRIKSKFQDMINLDIETF